MKTIDALFFGVLLISLAVALTAFALSINQDVVITESKAEVRAFIRDCKGVASISKQGDFYELRCKG